jgi:hypothetical protein
MKVFTKERVGNFVAGSTIFFTLYAIVFQNVGAETLPVLTALSGFSAKHLWDSNNSDK